MGTSFSLDYFDEILGERSTVFKDLMKTLVVTIDDYLEEYSRALDLRDSQQLSFVRHKYVTLIENLDIKELRSLHDLSKSFQEDFFGDPQQIDAHLVRIREVALDVRKGLTDVLATLEDI